MTRIAKQINITKSAPALPSSNHRGQFIAVRDTRNRRVPGLYVRNGRFYAQLWLDQGAGKKTARRLALLDADGLPVGNLAAAREALEVKRNDRREDKLPVHGRRPLFADYCAAYLAKATVLRKRPGTLENERQALTRWQAHLGALRIDRVTTPQIAHFLDKRLAGALLGGKALKPVKERTANLDLLMLRNVLKMAVQDGHLREMPKMPRLEEAPTPKRSLLTPADFERLLVAAPVACAKNAQQLTDYLQFLAFSGAREQEALRVRWDDVDFQRERVTIGADGLAKNRESRTVEFNARLGTHLRAMHARRAPDCSWLFPSPQRGPRDQRAMSFRESLRLARKLADLPRFGFHDLRHYFCSVCVMAGIDFMTIAAWLGHKDGGILVGKVYGHLLDEHRHKAARRVNF